MWSPRARRLAGDLESVALRHQDVEDDRVERATRPDRAQRLLAVGGELHVVALQLESALESTPELRLVVYDQYAHEPMLARSPENV